MTHAAVHAQGAAPRTRAARRIASLAVAFALALTSGAGRADDTSLDKARDYFRAGAQAYAVGEYAAAVQAFEQANALAPRPAVLFSIAQAERRLYFVDRDRTHLEKAVRLYREYLEKEPQGTRKVDAVQALSEIEPLLVTTASSSALDTAAQQRISPTRVMISSAVANALISLDGKPASPSPLITEVSPERHAVRVFAPGYVDSEREIVAVQGGLVTLDVPLVERPAKLVVLAPEGALLSIDGRVQGECPFPRPLELPSGAHLVTLTKSGLVGVSQERVLQRGQTEVLRASMPRSPQRTASLMMIGAGVSALAAGGVFGYVSLGRNRAAQQFLDQRGRSPLTAEDLEQYNTARDERDTLRTAALVSAGTGALLMMGGTLLFVLDHRVLEGAPRPLSGQDSPPRLEVYRLIPRPLLAPEMAGLGLQALF